jgi:tellurite resistance-related uncharacterized protein
MAGRAALQGRLVIVNALKARRCQKTYRVQEIPLWSVQGASQILSEWVSTRSNPWGQIFSLLVGKIGRRTSNMASNSRTRLHRLTPSLDDFTDRVVQSLIDCHVSQGEACLPIFSVAEGAPPDPRFGCLREMLSQIFIGSLSS